MREGTRWALVGVLFCLAGISVGRQDGNLEVRTELKSESRTIPFETVYEFSRQVGTGRTKLGRAGKAGKVETTYKLTYAGARLVKKVALTTVKTPPENAIMLMGTAGTMNARGSMYARGKVIDMVATAYDPTGGRGGGPHHTASGTRAMFGVAAVDPRVIPLGSELFVEGYGYAIAQDKGSAIKGNRIDLCFNDRSSAMRYGRKKVRVHVLRVR